MFKFRLLIGVIFMSLMFIGQPFAGPNANVTISLDLITDGGPGNQIDDGVTSGTVSGQGTKIAFEVFAKGVVTPLTDVFIQFGFDKSILKYNGRYGKFDSGNAAFDTMNVHENSSYHNQRYVFLSRGKSSGIIGESGFLARVEFITIKDVTDIEFRFTLLRVLLSEHGVGGDNPSDNIVPSEVVSVKFNSRTPTITQNGPGPNANATASLDLISNTDLIVAGIAGNQRDDGVLSDIHPGVGQLFIVEVFVTGATTPLTSARVVFDYDTDILRLLVVYNRELFPIYDSEYTGGTLRSNSPVTLPSSGYLLSAEFATTNEKELHVGVRKLTLTVASGEQDDITTTDVISLRLASSVPLPPPPFTPPSPPPPPDVFTTPIVIKNVLPGDLNGDGMVNAIDLSIFSENFGRTDGDTFDPNNLVDASSIPSGFSGVLTRPQITVKQGDWGNIPINEVRRIFDRVRDVFTDRLVYPTDSNIIVEPTIRGPRIFYDRERDGSYRIRISRSASVGGLVFQFAHEYGHILSNYAASHSPVYQRYSWFEESIASLASLFAFRMIPEFEHIFHGRIKNIRVSENGFGGFAPSRSNPRSLSRWYQHHRVSLEDLSRDYDKEEVVALMLFDIFENYPNDAWNAVRYMNRLSLRRSDNFESYLNGWYRCTPPQWQFIVEHIMYRFGVPQVDGLFQTNYPVSVE